MGILRDKIKINENQYFTSEGEEEGRYIVALRNSETTEMLDYGFSMYSMEQILKKDTDIFEKTK